VRKGEGEREREREKRVRLRYEGTVVTLSNSFSRTLSGTLKDIHYDE